MKLLSILTIFFFIDGRIRSKTAPRRLLDYVEGESRGEIETIIQDPDFGVHRTTLGEVFDEYPKDYGRPCQNVIENTKRGLG